MPNNILSEVATETGAKVGVTRAPEPALAASGAKDGEARPARRERSPGWAERTSGDGARVTTAHQVTPLQSPARRASRTTQSRPILAAVLILSGWLATSSHGQLSGELGAHDPSAVVQDGSVYSYFATGQGIVSRTSTDLDRWSAGRPVFTTLPSWTTQAVPGFEGVFWAPDVAYFNERYHLYYSVSTWGSIDSAIGVATSPTLVNASWTDRGKVIQSDAAWSTSPTTDTTVYNAIDPSVLVDGDRIWMSWGSYSSGIVVTELDPATGKPLGGSVGTMVANNSGSRGWGSTLEASALVHQGEYFYLFVNAGGCCSGVDSTYEIRVGRGTSPTGPFYDKNGVDLRDGGGSVFLDDNGRQLGPGHFERLIDGGQDFFSYHFYNGDAMGGPTFGLRELYWTASGWPSLAEVSTDWKGAVSDAWGQATNWWDAAVPDGVGHIAAFGSRNAARRTVQIEAAGRTVGTVGFTGSGSYTLAGGALRLDAAAGDSATLNATSGSHRIDAAITAADRLEGFVGRGARLTTGGSLATPGLTKYGYGTLALDGSTNVSGTLLVKWGTLEVGGAVRTSQYASVGTILAEEATLVVKGGGSLTVGSDLNIGDTGNAIDTARGTLVLQDQGRITVESAGGFFVGSGFFANTKAEGSVLQTGGSLTVNAGFDGGFVIGGRSSSLPMGVYHLDGGSVTANTNLQVGGRGTGSIDQTAGSFTANGFISIGRYQGAVGDWTLSGGALTQVGSGRRLIVGEGGSGSLTVTGSGEVSLAGPLQLGSQASATGTVRLAGGVLTTPRIYRGSGSASWEFDGGLLRAAGSSSSFMQGLSSAVVAAGGAIIDTQNYSITIAQSLGHDPTLSAADGGLAKRGSGMLTLSAANTYTGPTVVEAGTLRLAHAAALGGGGLRLEPGSLLALAPGLVVHTAALDLAGGRIDLADGRLEIAAAGTTEAALRAGLVAGRGVGRWNGGAGLTSSVVAAATAGSRELGYLIAADGSAIVGMAAPGDTDLNGRVDVFDLVAIGGGGDYGSGGAASWATGDMNYDGKANIFDVVAINTSGAYGLASYRSAAVAAVPEPAAVVAIALLSIAWATRRRGMLRGRSQAPGG